MIGWLLRRLFRPARGAAPQGPVIHIHEDDCGMRNLFPVTAWEDVRDDLERAAEASERNRVPGGVGWNDVYVTQPPKTSFREAGLTTAQVIAALQPLLPRVRRFNATISSAIGSERRDSLGSYEDDAICFGFDASCYIKVDKDSELVAAIWFDWRGADTQQLATLRAGLSALDAIIPCVLVDYFLDAGGRVADSAFMDSYFASYSDG